jgi:hypothetical protein
MAEGAPNASRALALAKTVATFAAAWALSWPLAVHELYGHSWFRWVIDAIYRVLSGFPAAAYFVEQLFRTSVDILAWSSFGTLILASGLAPLGAMVRMIARARIRVGQRDLLDPVRAWMSAHPQLTRALFATPGLFALHALLWPGHHGTEPLDRLLVVAPASLLVAWGLYALSKRGARALLAPTLEGESASTMTIGADEIVFDAVAVTREAKGIIAALAALPLAVVALIGSRPLASLFHDRWPFYVMASYIVVATVTAVVFQKASRVAVGVDGVHVRGTSRAKFHAYRDLDGARANGADIELVRRGRVVVRLQLHGQDAARRDAVLARMTNNIARVKSGGRAMAAQMVASASEDALARVAHGAGDYRVAALTREQLWALVEGPEIAGDARRAAAAALAKASDERERDRLRVAASLCAEPQVRIALEEMARGDEDVAVPPRRRATT